MKYTLIHPSFDLPQGKAREFLDKFIEASREEGGAEIASLARLLLNDDALSFANYLNVEGCPVHRLCQEFLKFICRSKPPAAPLYIAPMQSATAAITAALMANKVTSGEVITTSLNFLGVPNAIALAGAEPRFVDVDPDTFMMDPASLEKAVSKKTKAIVFVHFNQVGDLDAMGDVLNAKGLDIPLIQDASLAMGSTHKGTPAGLVNMGTGGATVYSFATSKILSGLGGAVVLSGDKKLIMDIEKISYQGMDFASPEELASFGANFKMNDLNAAIALEQLKKCDAIFERRRILRSWYDRELSDVVDTGKISLQKVSHDGLITHYAVLVPDRAAAAKRLAERGVMLGLWHTAHLQKIYQKRFKTRAGTLPVTESIAGRIAFLPFHTRLSEKDVQFICRNLKEAV